MSHPGHIVVRFGNTVANFYKHSGSETITGLTLLRAIAIAPGHKERGYFEDGEYIIKRLMEINSPLAEMKMTRGSFVTGEFRLIGADIGQSFEYGFMLESIRGSSDADFAEHKSWRIHYNDSVDAGDVLEDWLPNSETFSPMEMAVHLKKHLGRDSYLFGNKCELETALDEVMKQLRDL